MAAAEKAFPGEPRRRRATPSAPPDHVDDFADLLCWRAEVMPDREAFAFLGDGGRIDSRLTFAELAERAGAVAARLDDLGLAGQRVVLLYPTGPDYIVTLFGCLLAGATAVPAYPPGLVPRDRNLERLRVLLRDSGAAAVLAAQALPDGAPRLTQGAEDPPRWLTLDTGGTSARGGWRRPAVGGDTLALLQYTSGSTAEPKGVAIPHSSLMANCEQVRRVFGASAGDVLVYWLPLYHDYGLIGVVFSGLYRGCSAVLMSPLHFLQRPARWLQAITDHRAAFTGAPNFGYELCRRKVTDEQLASVDLSSLKAASTGGEPVRAATLRGFARRFASCGFRMEMLFPAYGLAETTLLATGGRPGSGPRIITVDPGALTEGRLQSADDGVPLVGCGQALQGHDLVIVDPDTRLPRPEGTVGEIWLRGPSVARGYWNRPGETARTFDARLADGGEEPTRGRGREGFLRSGDLGALVDGELYVTGRIKDLIIIDGLNHYPQDIELTVERCSDALRPGCSVAFSVDDGGAERLVVVAEVRSPAADTDELRQTIRAVVNREHGLAVHGLELLPAGAVPKTTSGKLRRRAARAAYLARST